MASEITTTRGFVEFSTPVQSEELSVFTRRVVAVISSEFEYVTSCVRKITDNTQEMVNTVKKLRSLAALGDISPQDFNQQATRYNLVVASRDEYSNLKDRINHLTNVLSQNINYLKVIQEKLQRIVNFNLPGDLFKLEVTTRLGDLNDNLAQLVRYELEVNEIKKPLRGHLKDEYDTIKALEARLNNGGMGLSKLQQGKTYLSSYVFSAAPPVEIALKEISTDHPIHADVEGGAGVAVALDQGTQAATVEGVANSAEDLSATASSEINKEIEAVAPVQGVATESVTSFSTPFTAVVAEDINVEGAEGAAGAASAASSPGAKFQDAKTHPVTNPRPAGKKHTRHPMKARVASMAR